MNYLFYRNLLGSKVIIKRSPILVEKKTRTRSLIVQNFSQNSIKYEFGDAMKHVHFILRSVMVSGTCMTHDDRSKTQIHECQDLKLFSRGSNTVKKKLTRMICFMNRYCNLRYMNIGIYIYALLSCYVILKNLICPVSCQSLCFIGQMCTIKSM